MAEAHNLEVPERAKTKFEMSNIKAGIRRMKKKIKRRIVSGTVFGTTRAAATRIRRRRRKKN